VLQAAANPRATAAGTTKRLSEHALRVVRSSPHGTPEEKQAKILKIEEVASSMRKSALNVNDENHSLVLDIAQTALLEEAEVMDEGGTGKAKVWSEMAEDMGFPRAKLTPGKW